ncbi:hypothetical protein DPMN_022063 [Dreissena polymorpha]|uniref:Uncharacterized protein n=1 Tax=Dreissena polymorpha TaxID=45954 RepID=A0A9D4NQ25_DREPO|nr:hypothetical protein DPMN_022063 [Dreissena polymorpha]
MSSTWNPGSSLARVPGLRSVGGGMAYQQFLFPYSGNTSGNEKNAARRRLWTTGSAESAIAQCDQRRRHRVMHAHRRLRIVLASGG